ncbi:hypothetical protein [Butyrivibrio proteoclasticus]|uniref:hypothetical protein n=1 Tax=Butyrivibrio proteoclasticus TaxID=43305 RepID=UPI00047941E8|nr:hypothetical protein [Butyrivibrio proteoclasticus]
MLSIARFADDYYEIAKDNNWKTVIYGAGDGFVSNRNKLPGYDAVYDKNAASIGQIGEDKIKDIQELKSLNEPVNIIVCIVNGDVFDAVCNDFIEAGVNGNVFHFFNNVAFIDNCWGSAKSYKVKPTKEALNVNIICTDSGWIFRKFAIKMEEELKKLGVNVKISEDVDENADINHHIPFATHKARPNDTLMITHVDTSKKVAMIRKQLKTAGMGICMSKYTMNMLVSYGIPRDKLCYVNPAHDHLIKPHKYVIGITHKCHDKDDLRKRATAILDVLEGVDPDYFEFKIMGAGWEQVAEEMRKKGFGVELFPDFDLEKYTDLMSKIDYFMYMGFDEGTMGFQDALYAGAGTIVTPQGYHLEMGVDIDYPCETIEEFRAAFLDLQNKRKMRRNAVENQTWEEYTKKHLTIWKYLLEREPLTELYKNQSEYMDGIFSVLLEDNRI